MLGQSLTKTKIINTKKSHSKTKHLTQFEAPETSPTEFAFRAEI